MRKVIKGRTYSTDTATLVGSWDNGLSNSDFNTCSESLMRTPNGRFFLHGSGGAGTRWASGGHGDCSWHGSGIRTITDAEALEWCEHHAIEADIIEANFDIEEG